MTRELCIIHANCQGDPLADLLAGQPDFAARYEVRRYTNYLKERIPPHELTRCALFIYQHLGERWDDLSSQALLRLVPSACRVLQVPNMLFKGYWPFWTNQSSMDFGDSFLDRLAGMGLDRAEMLHVYLHGDLTRKYDLVGMLEKSLAIEEDKERNAVVHTVPLVRSLWQHEKLFATINHPQRRLLLHVADGVLAALGMEGVPADVADAFAVPYTEFELPIHPQVAALHGLPFADAQTRYHVYGKTLTFEDYVRCYIDCRLRGIDSFIGYLHLVHV